VQSLKALSADEIGLLRAFRDQQMAQSALGRRLTSLIQRHGTEVAQYLATDDELRSQAADLLRRAFEVVQSARGSNPVRVDEAMVRDLANMADRLSSLGGASLKRDIQRIRPELDAINGKSAAEIL
jgi:ketopantoate reductase